MIVAKLNMQSESEMFRWELWNEDELITAGSDISPYRAFVAAQEALTNQYTLTERL